MSGLGYDMVKLQYFINEKCKLRCPHGHYFMSGPDFDFAN
jgi:hypothetical protein